MVKNFTFICGILIFCACSSLIHINENDISAYRIELNQKEPFNPPFVSRFKKQNLSLTYIAANHVEGIDNSTCKTIKDQFSNIKPLFLLVEGRPFTKINDQSVIEYVKNCESENYKNCGEDVCALKEAITSKIPFNYAEPSDLSIKEEILKQGYLEKELMFFYALRQIPQLKRQGIFEELEIRKKIISFLERHSTKRLDLKTPLTIDDFERIYFSKLNKKINYSSIDTEVVSPQIDKDPTWANLMAHKVGQVREKFINRMIEIRVNEYKSVMIVYGAGHLTKSRKALENAFGSVTNKKLFE